MLDYKEVANSDELNKFIEEFENNVLLDLKKISIDEKLYLEFEDFNHASKIEIYLDIVTKRYKINSRAKYVDDSGEINYKYYEIKGMGISDILKDAMYISFWGERDICP